MVQDRRKVEITVALGAVRRTASNGVLCLAEETGEASL
jgi:hypothetical protein